MDVDLTNRSESAPDAKSEKIPVYRTTILPTSLIAIGLVVAFPLNLLAGLASAAVSWWYVTHSRLVLKRLPSGIAPITKRARILFTAAGVLFAVACLLTRGASGSELACSSDDAKDLVAQIFRADLIKLPNGTYDLKGAKALENATFDIEDIRTTAKDDSTGAVSCAATIHTRLPEGTHAYMLGRGDGPIEYHLSRTDDGRLYAEASRAQ